jgi:hypothetical protein
MCLSASEPLMHGACHLEEVSHGVLRRSHQHTMAQVHDVARAPCCAHSVQNALLDHILGTEQHSRVHVALHSITALRSALQVQ